MATRAVADASVVAATATPTMQADKGNVELSVGVSSVPQSVPQAVIDSAVYAPSSLSAFANAAPVAAATADVTPLPSPASSARRVVAPVASTVTTRSKVGRHSSKFGTVNYSIDEMRRLNDKVRAVMPIASEDWLHVAYQFNYMRPESIPYREVESLKRKFKKMYCSRSTVGGKLPDYVQDAKDLRKQINQRSERAQIQLEQTNSDSQSEGDPQDAASEDQAKSDEAAGAEAPLAEDASMATESAGEPTHAVSASVSASAAAGVVSEETRAITARLRVMEEEYHRSMASKRGSAVSAASAADGGGGGVSGVAAGAASSYAEPTFAAQLAAPLSAASVYAGGALSGDSTAGIIHLLKHSIERKRRTIEEQMLSESERVRKERKKRKMEQVLYNIHREHEIATSGSAADAVAASDAPGATPYHTAMLSSAATPSPVAQSQSPDAAASSPSSSLGVMEIVLSYMVTQQQEAARRAQLEDEQRRVEQQQRDQRRRAKERQRRKDKREMMLVMAALLQDGFPQELRHYLEPASGTSDSELEEHDGQDDSRIRGPAPSSTAIASKPPSSDATAAAAAAAAIASSLAPVTGTLL